MRARAVLTAALLAATAWPLAAQQPLVVTVTTADGQPLAGAVLEARRARSSARTDRLGRARFERLPRPDTLAILFVGFAPDTLVVGEADSVITVSLSARTPTLAALTVFGGADALTPAATGLWVVPREMMFEAPAAIEPDPLRALALLPSVNFSSPLSARPLLRGYDADESVIRLDQYELLNPYHIARAFSAIPADAIERVAVAPSAFDAAAGQTLAGVVDLDGRGAGVRPGNRGGAALSPVSATGFVSGPRSVPVFAAGRLGFLERFSGLLGESVPYAFRDLYLRGQADPAGALAADATAYLSHDDVGNDADGSDNMTWTNQLLGGRLRAVDRSSWSADVTASWNAYDLAGTALLVRGSTVNVANRLTRASVALAGGFGASRWLQAGAGYNVRQASTSVVKLSGDDVFPADADDQLDELQAWVQGTGRTGRFLVTAGLRLDAARGNTVLQPRVRLVAPLGAATAAVSYARAGRLYYLLSDPAPEPQLVFPQFWLAAGDSTGVPVVDHLAASLDWSRSGWQVSAAAYASRGVDLGELRPTTDPGAGASAFRFGDSRTAGLELRVARAGSGRWAPQVSLSYVLSASERRWEDGNWRPWRLDRMHLARLQFAAAPGRWQLFATADAQSGQPLTPVREVIHVDPPPLDAAPNPGSGPLAYRYADENSVRSAGTLRFDVGALYRTRGPWGSRLLIGASVINAGVGPVAPEQPMAASRLGMLPPSQRAAGVPYQRAFTLPAVPTVNLRLEF